jgi:hypothetical protein
MVERRLYELMLGVESAPTAQGMLAEHRQGREREASRNRELIHEEPALAAAREWLGAYRTASDLGFTLAERDGHLVLDEGGWNSRVALHDQVGAEPTLVLIDAPLAGLELRRDTTDGRKTLVLDGGPTSYRFERADDAH